MMRINPDGIIKGGTLNINYDPSSQIMKVDGIIKVGISIIIKKIPFDESKVIARDLMKSTAFWQGRKETIEGVTISVISNKEDYAIVTFEHGAGDSGVFEVSLKNEYAEVIRILAKTQYMGKQINVEAIKT